MKADDGEDAPKSMNPIVPIVSFVNSAKLLETDPIPPVFTRKRKRIMLLSSCILYLTSFLAFSTMSPFYTTEALKKGSTKTVSGAVFASNPFVIFVISPFIGKYLTNLGPMFVLLSGSFLEAGCQVLFGFLGDMPSTITFVSFSFLIRILMAVGSAFSQTATLSIISYIHQENVSSVVGLFEFASGIGLMLGPAIGGFLFDVGGFRLPFLVLGSFMFLMLIIVALALPRKQALLGENVEELAPVGKVLKIPGVLLAVMTIIYCGTSISFYDAILAVHLTDITKGEISKTTIGLFFLSSNAVYAVASAVCGYYGGKYMKSETTVFIGQMFCFVTYFFIGPAPFLKHYIHPSLWLVGVTFSLSGISWAPLIVLPFKCMQNAIKSKDLRVDLPMLSLLSGLITSCYNIGAAIGPLYGGFVLEYFSFQWATFILSLGFLILAILQAAYIRNLRKHDYEMVLDNDVDTKNPTING